MKDTTKYIGMDVHKETITVAVADAGRESARVWGTIPNRPEAVRKLMRQLGSTKQLEACYEAGPCGYVLQRQLEKMGIRCVVVAPSLIPRRPGDRIKTDRRDAVKLAQLLRSGELTAVWVPDEEHEALRDLVRAREAARQDVTRARHRIGKLLLRQGLQPPEGVRPWTIRYRQWLDALHLSHRAQEIVLREYLRALDEAESRLRRLEAEIAEAVKDSPHVALVAALQAMRGVSLVTAVTLVAELGDLTRFDNPRQLMAYVGMVPSESSSGGKRHQGALTKTGNPRVRRVVIEAAWHYRFAPACGAALRKRQESTSPEVRAIAWKAQHRLNTRYRRLMGRGKPKPKVIAALGRELLGFIWAIAQEVAKSENRLSVAA